MLNSNCPLYFYELTLAKSSLDGHAIIRRTNSSENQQMHILSTMKNGLLGEGTSFSTTLVELLAVNSI